MRKILMGSFVLVYLVTVIFSNVSYSFAQSPSPKPIPFSGSGGPSAGIKCNDLNTNWEDCGDINVHGHACYNPSIGEICCLEGANVHVCRNGEICCADEEDGCCAPPATSPSPTPKLPPGGYRF